MQVKPRTLRHIEPAWLAHYPDNFRDALIDYGMDPDSHPQAHQYNERLQEFAETEMDELIFRARVPDLYAEIFGEGPDDGD